jgi:hypothetical protein
MFPNPETFIKIFMFEGNAEQIIKTVKNSKKISVVEIRMKSAAAGKTRFFDPPHMIFAA